MNFPKQPIKEGNSDSFSKGKESNYELFSPNINVRLDKDVFGDFSRPNPKKLAKLGSVADNYVDKLVSPKKRPTDLSEFDKDLIKKTEILESGFCHFEY